MDLEHFVLAQGRKQVPFVDAGPHALEDVEPLRLGRNEALRVQLRNEADKFVLGRRGRSGAK